MTTWQYDSANRLSSIEHKRNSTTFASYAYTYDGLSRITSIQSLVDGLTEFTYDATSQLLGADHASQPDENFGYDLNGNRNTSGFTTGQNNQTLAGDGFTYTYDDEGNRTSRTETAIGLMKIVTRRVNEGSLTALCRPLWLQERASVFSKLRFSSGQTATGKVQGYVWDYRNRLVSVRERNSAGGPIVEQVDYAYDPLNRMVRRTYDADGAGPGSAIDQFWAHDEGINALLEFDGPSTTNLRHRYLWSDQVDELLADTKLTNLTTAGNALWALSDHLGTIRDIADYVAATDTTTVTNHRVYNAYGKLVSETNPAVDVIFGFTGKQYDKATELQHNLFRWYDPNLGQWLTEDPLSFTAGDENLRRYVGNQHSLTFDPLGLQDPNQPSYIPPISSSPGMGYAIEYARAHKEMQRQSESIDQIFFRELEGFNQRYAHTLAAELTGMGVIVNDIIREVKANNISVIEIRNGDSHYSPFWRTMNLRRDEGIRTMIHEGIHAVDHMRGQNIRSAVDWQFGEAAYRRRRAAEGVAYAALLRCAKFQEFLEFESVMEQTRDVFTIAYEWQAVGAAFRRWEEPSSWIVRRVIVNEADVDAERPFVDYLDEQNLQRLMGVQAIDLGRVGEAYNARLRELGIRHELRVWSSEEFERLRQLHVWMMEIRYRYYESLRWIRRHLNPE